MPPVRLTDADRDSALRSITDWTYDSERDALYRQLRFKDFAEALAAMVRIGVIADKMDHHPEWTNVYDRLDIWLTTHDAKGVSARDIELARLIDAIFNSPDNIAGLYFLDNWLSPLAFFENIQFKELG